VYVLEELIFAIFYIREGFIEPVLAITSMSDVVA
jgi:hypothetical protein